MIWNGKYVSVKPIIEKVYRDMGYTEAINFGDAIEWIGEAIEFIGAPLTLLDKVELIDICKRRGQLPADLHLIITIWGSVDTRKNAEEHNRPCNGFMPMRYSTDAMHMYCREIRDVTDYTANLYLDRTYKVNDDFIFTNFNEGTVKLAYKAIPTCENGYPMIPDDVKFKNAVAYHIMWKIGFKMLMQDKISKAAYQILERDRDWYIAAAQTRGNTPNPDMMESIKNNWLRLIKKINQHGDAFKSAGKEEERYSQNSLPIPGNTQMGSKRNPTFFNIEGDPDNNFNNNNL